MTLEEKAKLVCGMGMTSKKVPGAVGSTYEIPRLGIPEIVVSDGPAGLRLGGTFSGVKAVYATAFPIPAAMASTWDLDLLNKVGVAMGAESKAFGVDVLLGPAFNIKRDPLNGRNFEYLTEDPYLNGRLAAAIVKGIQSEGVGVSIKHFAVNNQETNRMSINEVVSERALREIYLSAFEYVVKNSDPWTVMSSYPKINGVHGAQNKYLLTDILKNEWKFNGLVMSDWFAVKDPVAAVNAGNDLIMPGGPKWGGQGDTSDDVLAGLKNGTIKEADIDKNIKNILKIVLKTLSFKGELPTNKPDLKANVEIVRKTAAEGMVLLKNESSFLPIPKKARIALFGVTAYKSIAGGTGSSNVNKPHIIDISTGLEKAGYTLNDRFKGIYTKYMEFQNDILDKHPESADWEKLSYYRTVIPEMDLSKAESIIECESKKSDIALIVIGRGSGEESDRRLEGDFYLTPEEKLMIEKVSAQFHSLGKKVAVILNVCGVMEMNSWKDQTDAILLAWFPGQECETAIADVISGKVNPSGKLPMTFPVDYYDIPSSRNFPMVGHTNDGKNFNYTNYEEGIWIGYRYFNTVNQPVAYPFGYGLSYTVFSFREPRLERKKDKWIASIRVANIGEVSGKEVVQLYVSAPQNSIQKPSYELKAFGKTRDLKPGESEIVKLQFTDYDIASFDEDDSRWFTSKGTYMLSFGSSSRDFKAAVPFNVNKDKSWKVHDVLKPVEKLNVMRLPVK